MRIAWRAKMDGALRSTSTGGAVVLAGVAAVTVVAILGIAAMVLATQCPIQAGGLGRCFAALDPVATGSIEPEVYETANEDNVSTVIMTKAASMATPEP